MTSTHLKFRYKKLGGHVHVRVFTGVPGFTFGKAGELVFNEEEWPAMYELLSRSGPRVIIESEEQSG